MTRLSEGIKKPSIKEALKKIQNLINNQNVLIQYPGKGEHVNPCVYVYKTKTQSDGVLDKLKLRIMVRGDLKNKKLVGDTLSSRASMRTLKYFLEDAAKHEARVHHLDSFGSILTGKIKNRIFVKLDSRYADYFP